MHGGAPVRLGDREDARQAQEVLHLGRQRLEAPEPVEDRVLVVRAGMPRPLPATMPMSSPSPAAVKAVLAEAQEGEVVRPRGQVPGIPAASATSCGVAAGGRLGCCSTLWRTDLSRSSIARQSVTDARTSASTRSSVAAISARRLGSVCSLASTCIADSRSATLAPLPPAPLTPSGSSSSLSLPLGVPRVTRRIGWIMPDGP